LNLAAICCTYKRPKLLAEAIECFLRQDYPAELREMIVLDDAGQYENQVGDGWRLVSSPVRFRTLGEKRNASAALVSPDVDAYCVWDDDDIYLPWHMCAAAEALRDADYAIPSIVLIDKKTRLERKSNHSLFHGAWSFRCEAFEQVGGYPFIQSGQDQGLLQRFRAAELRRVDPLEYEAPSYIYRWFTVHQAHISAMGGNGYEILGGKQMESVGDIKPKWDRDWRDLFEVSS